MIKIRKSKYMLHIATAAFGLSLITGMIRPLPVYAGQEFQLEKTFETNDKNDSAKEQFPDVYEKDGKLFRIKNICTELVSSRKVEGESIFFDSEIFLDKKENHEPKMEVEKDGTVYSLKEQELLKGTVPERLKYIESVSDYELEYIDMVPDKGAINVSDRDTGQIVKGVLPAVDVQITGEKWSDDFSFPILVTEYDANVFLLGELPIPQTAELFDYRNEILDFLELPSDFYEILSVKWDGEAYMEDGILKRKAIASGRKRLQEVSVKYAGNVKFDEIEGNYYHCRYARKGSSEETVYTIKATAVYERKRMGLPELLKRLFRWFREHPIAGIKIFLLLLMLLNILITYILSKKEEKKEEKMIDFSEEEDEENHDSTI